MEDTSSIAVGSHTRWFRVRSRGVAGDSAWRYAKRVYATPYQADITKTDIVNGEIYTEWNSDSTEAYPNDTVEVQYTKVVPNAGMTCPSDASWTTSQTIMQKNSGNAASYSVDGSLTDDQVMFTRVNTIHLNKTTYGVPKVVSVGKLSAPTIGNVTTDDATYSATVNATNNSEVPDSFLVVVYRTMDNPDEFATVGIIPHGGTSANVRCPNWTGKTKQFGVYAATGTYAAKASANGATLYSVTPIMQSDVTWQAGTIPNAPTGVSASATSVAGSVKVTWQWSWSDADNAVISWADHEDAWQSTDEPEQYVVSSIHASEWIIAGLETGKRWYIRVRLAMGTEDPTYSPWSEMVTVDLSSAPNVPWLTLSAGTIVVGGSISAYWTYTSTDGTGQAYAELCEATLSGNGVAHGVPFASTQSAQSITLYADDLGWNSGETHYLCVRVVSGSGRASDSWSNPVPVNVAEPLVCEVASTSLVQQTITVEDYSDTIYSLTEMPLTATIEGAGNGGTTTLVIERAADYHVDRPNGEDFNGYAGETIAIFTQIGESEIIVNREDLLGLLDDGAAYNLIATVKDGLGQSDEVVIPFEVHWSHQAVMPTATAEILDGITHITPTQPVDGYEAGDTVDIYRLSADKPELIVENGVMGTTYVDPYPTIGDHGGYRVVYKTIDGDYITSGNDLAWIDIPLPYDVDYSIIDFDGEQVRLRYGVDVSNNWEKDFKKTRYLGGSIQGDWNKGIDRSGSVSSAMITITDFDTIVALRRLANYAGICHVRTKEGSSYAADIQIAESNPANKYGQVVTFDFNIQRVETQEHDGLTLDEWSGGEDELE